MMVVDETVTIDLASHFTDPDGDLLTFDLESSDSDVASASVSGSEATLAAAGQGTAAITATARDPGGLSAVQSFTVTVEDEAGRNADRAALAAIYEATGGAGWTDDENWLTDAPLASWHGVRVDSLGRVTELSLMANKLSGSIPPELL